MASNDECVGKAKYLNILRSAGLPREAVTQELCHQLPTKSQVARLYGSQPIIHGLEQCQEFRSGLVVSGDEKLAPQVRVTGLYNTATNAFTSALHANLQDGTEKALETNTVDGAPSIEKLYGVPWNKHFPIEARTNWVAAHSPESARQILTVVLIREPFRWMQSMVRRHLVSLSRMTLLSRRASRVWCTIFSARLATRLNGSEVS